MSAVLKWAAANGRRLNKSDLERMGAGVDAMVAENERLIRERDELLSRVKRLEEAGHELLYNNDDIGNINRWHKAKEAKP